MARDDLNYTRDAFLATPNLLFLVAGLVTAIGLHVGVGIDFWLVALFVLAGESLYLGIVPRSARFQKAMRARHLAEAHKPPSQRERFEALSDHSQRRYARLRALRDEVRANYVRLGHFTAEGLADHMARIDGLVASYLDLLHRREQYRRQVGRAGQEAIRRSIEKLKADMADDAERVREVKARRLRVLEQRLDRFRDARDNVEITSAQLVTIEDNVKYIHEQSWTMQNAEEIDRQLAEIEAVRDAIRETTPPSSYAGQPVAAPHDEADAEAALDAELDAALAAAGADAPDPPRLDADRAPTEAPPPDESAGAASGDARRRVRG